MHAHKKLRHTDASLRGSSFVRTFYVRLCVGALVTTTYSFALIFLVTKYNLENQSHNSHQPTKLEPSNEPSPLITITNPVACNILEYCIGRECDFQCSEFETLGSVSYLGSHTGALKLVDIDNSRQCIFQYPASCDTCRCVNRTTIFTSEEAFRMCRPCQFKSLGWLRASERKKCAPEICPTLFPLTCGISLLSAKYISNVINTTHTNGLWISLVGDSLLRGIFLKAVSFLSIRSKPIHIAFNRSTYHQDHYICCTVSHHPGRGNEPDRCAVHMHAPSKSSSLPRTVAADLFSRRRASLVGRDIPVCVSWQWNTAAADLPALLNQFESTHADSGIRPASISVNPGLHSLGLAFDLDNLVHDLDPILERCATLFGGSGGRSSAVGRPCILHTTAHTTLTREEAVVRQHRRHHTSIRGYNAAASAAWAGGRMPIIDAGALSLVPAVSNNADADGVHYNADGNPFYDISWQLILNTALADGAQVCEAQ
jgi:hypothetical protein